MLPIIGFYGLISCVFTFGKQAVNYVQPFFLTSSRLPLAGLVLVTLHTYLYRHKKYSYTPSLYFICLYGIALLIGDSFRFISMTSIPASHAALISATGPFITALSSHFLLNEHITMRKIYALLLGFISIVPLVWQSISVTMRHTFADYTTIIIGYGAAFISVIGFVASAYALKVLLSRMHYPAFLAAGLGTMVGGVMGIVISLCIETWNPLPITSLHEAFPYLAMLFIGHNVIGYMIWAQLLKKYPVSLVSLGQFTLPIFTALLRYFFFADQLTWMFGISLVVLAGAFYLFYSETKKQLYARDNTIAVEEVVHTK